MVAGRTWARRNNACAEGNLMKPIVILISHKVHQLLKLRFLFNSVLLLDSILLLLIGCRMIKYFLIQDLIKSMAYSKTNFFKTHRCLTITCLLALRIVISECWLEYEINFESRNRPIINYELILKFILFISTKFSLNFSNRLLCIWIKYF